MSAKRVGIVGCGAIADFLHAPAIAASRNCEIGGFCDVHLGQASDLARKYVIEAAFESITQMANHVDFVILASPPHTHLELSRQAFDHGLHVICEKPFANTVAECEQICALAAQSGRKLGVFHQYRFWPSRIAVGERIRNAASTVSAVSVSQGNLYSWSSVSGYTVRSDLVAGGVLINAGIHPMDTLISWFGDPAELHYLDDACGGLESNVRMRMEFRGDVKGSFRMSRTAKLANEIRVHCSDHDLVVNNGSPFSYVIESHSAEHCEPVICGESELGFLRPAADLYDCFADTIDGKIDFPVDGQEALRVIRWVENCYQQKKKRDLPTLAPVPGLCW